MLIFLENLLQNKDCLLELLGQQILHQFLMRVLRLKEMPKRGSEDFIDQIRAYFRSDFQKSQDGPGQVSCESAFEETLDLLAV